MPRYLGKDYLSEEKGTSQDVDVKNQYLAHHLQFLQQNVLIVPTHLEHVDNYVHVQKEIYSHNLHNELLKEFKTRNLDEDTSCVIKSDFKMTTATTTNKKSTVLECYNPNDEVKTNKNIIEIDSDSDLNSSYGSTTANTPNKMDRTPLSNFNREVFDSIFTSSLCSSVFRSDIDEMLLEELDHEPMLKETCVKSSLLCRRLRPVRVSDPFVDATFPKISLLASISNGVIDDDVNGLKEQVDSKDIFKKVVLDEMNTDLFLEEVIMDNSVTTTGAQDIPMISSCNEFKVIPIDQDEKEDISLLQNFISTQWKCHVESYPNDDIQNTASFQPVVIEETLSNEKLDSPMSDIDAVLCNTQKQQFEDLCESQKQEEIFMENEKMEIVSPSRKEEICRKIWNADRVFGDILLMTLKDPEEQKIEFSTNLLQLPAMDMLETCYFHEKLFEHLIWDPIPHVKDEELEKTQRLLFCQEIITKGDRKKKKASYKSLYKFNRIEICHADLKIDRKLENWKDNEKKHHHSLQFITDYKTKVFDNNNKNNNNNKQNNILSQEQQTAAPGDINLKVFEDSTTRNDLQQKQERKQEQQLERLQRGDVSMRTPVSVSTRNPSHTSPLDAFMMLRTGKPTHNKKNVVFPSIRNVSAVKVKPMMRDTDANPKLAMSVTPAMCEADIKKNIRPRNKEHVNFNTSSSFRTTSFRETSTPVNCDNKQQSSSSTTSSGLGTNQSTNQVNRVSCQKMNNENVLGESQCKENPTSSINSSVEKKQTVIDIHLPKTYIEIIHALDRNAASLIQFLKDSKSIGSDMRLLSITPGISRFLLKDEMKAQNKGQSNPDIYRGIICLHALVQVIDLLVHYDTPIACSVLKAFTQEHQDMLRNCLEPVRKKLSLFHCKNVDHGLVHPTFSKLSNLIQNWLKLDQNTKILILIGRYFDHQAPSLQSFLSTINGIHVELYPNSNNVTQSFYVNTFQNSNVILAKESAELEFCPWQFFQFVIQYEYREESCWHESVFSWNPNLKDFIALNVSYDVFTENQVSNPPSNVSSGRLQHTVLCSKQAIFHREFLIALENKENLKLLIKDNNIAGNEDILQPDFLLNERTCIVLIQLGMDIQTIYPKISSAVMKCCVCHVICYVEDTTKLVNMQCELAAFIAQINHDFKYIQCGFYYSFTIDDLAEQIRMFCDLALKNTTVWSQEQWIDRNWLAEETSKVEKFLLSYPCINVFCAKLMSRSKATINQLLSCTFEQLKSAFQQIPEHVLKSFYLSNRCIPVNQHQQQHAVINLVGSQNDDDISTYPQEENEFYQSVTQPISYNTNVNQPCQNIHQHQSHSVNQVQMSGSEGILNNEEVYNNPVYTTQFNSSTDYVSTGNLSLNNDSGGSSRYFKNDSNVNDMLIQDHNLHDKDSVKRALTIEEMIDNENADVFQSNENLFISSNDEFIRKSTPPTGGVDFQMNLSNHNILQQNNSSSSYKLQASLSSHNETFGPLIQSHNNYQNNEITSPRTTDQHVLGDITNNDQGMNRSGRYILEDITNNNQGMNRTDRHVLGHITNNEQVMDRTDRHVLGDITNNAQGINRTGRHVLGDITNNEQGMNRMSSLSNIPSETSNNTFLERFAANPLSNPFHALQKHKQQEQQGLSRSIDQQGCLVHGNDQFGGGNHHTPEQHWRNKYDENQFTPTWSRNSNANFKTIPRQAVKAFTMDITRKDNHNHNKVAKNVNNSLLKTPSIKTNFKQDPNPPRSISLSTNKKRRLTYEKIPGAKDGQTRLTFL